MTATLIDGKAIAADIHNEVKAEVEALYQKTGQRPCLATVLVGEDPASQSYVRSKGRACENLGMKSIGHKLPETATQEEVEALVKELNADPQVNGILVQIPMPRHLDEEAILGAISIEKDVDGFHPVNIGRLAMKGREPLFVPCTPYGCIVLLERTGIKIEGANAVVLGRSNIVGLPVSMLLLVKNATVTVCHSKTRDLAAITRQADILVAAIGRAGFVTAEMVKPGAVVIDVGINRIEDPGALKGSRLVGDVDFESVKEVAGAITPVPGGIGPMTIAMLMKNTAAAFKLQHNLGK